jgi:tetratricopeptide (TPR) repeat protein
MTDDLTQLADEFLRNPRSLTFLELGERLRSAGRLEAAVRVALAGLEHHPGMAEAQDLYARVLADIGDTDRARTVWSDVLQRNPRHVGALMGLGYLCFVDRDYDGALEHLETALSVDPTDQQVVRALLRARKAAVSVPDAADAPAAAPGTHLFRGLDGAGKGMLLADGRGRVLGGRIETPRGGDVSEAAAAYVVGMAREAERTAAMLDLGRWEWVTVEGGAANVHVTIPEQDTLLLVARDRAVPAGRLARLAERACETARAWLKEQDL